jgi:hypothetical protein
VPRYALARYKARLTYCKPLKRCVSHQADSAIILWDTYLSVIGSASTEQSLKGVVSWKDESSSVDEELAGNVEEDEEKVQCS